MPSAVSTSHIMSGVATTHITWITPTTSRPVTMPRDITRRHGIEQRIVRSPRDRTSWHWSTHGRASHAHPSRGGPCGTRLRRPWERRRAPLTGAARRGTSRPASRLLNFHQRHSRPIRFSMGPSADPAAAALGKAINNEDEDVRKAVAYALATMGPGATPAVPALIKGLHDRITSVRLASAYAIGELGPRHPKALAALIAAINDSDDDVREELVFAIGEIGTDAKPVMDAMQRALQDPSRVVREAARKAIDKLQDDDDDDEPAAKKKAAVP